MNQELIKNKDSQNEDAREVPHTTELQLEEVRVRFPFPLFSDWLRDLECPIAFCVWDGRWPLDLKAILAHWQQAGRLPLEWPQGDLSAKELTDLVFSLHA